MVEPKCQKGKKAPKPFWGGSSETDPFGWLVFLEVGPTANDRDGLPFGFPSTDPNLPPPLVSTLLALHDKKQKEPKGLKERVHIRAAHAVGDAHLPKGIRRAVSDASDIPWPLHLLGSSDLHQSLCVFSCWETKVKIELRLRVHLKKKRATGLRRETKRRLKHSPSGP